MDDLTVAEVALRATVSDRTVRTWLRAPEGASEHLPSAMVTGKGSQQSGRSHYAVRAADLEALLARLTAPAPLPLDAITPGRAAEIFAGHGLEPGRDRDRCVEAVRAEAGRGRLTPYTIAGCVRYSRAQVGDVAKLRSEEADYDEPLQPWRAQLARKRRARRTGERLVAVEEASTLTGRGISQVRSWARNEPPLYGGQRIEGRVYFDRDLLPAKRVRAKPTPPAESRSTVTCAVCGAELDRSEWEVHRSAERAKLRGSPGLFFCGIADRRRQGSDAPDCLHTEKARTLLGHPSRKRTGKMSDETRRAMNRQRRLPLRAAWTQPRREQQGERIQRRLNTDVKAGELALRQGRSEAKRYGADEAEATRRRLDRITAQRADESDHMLEVKERERKAVELREAGWSDERIRAELEISDRQLRRYYVNQGVSRPRGRPPKNGHTP